MKNSVSFMSRERELIGKVRHQDLAFFVHVKLPEVYINMFFVTQQLLLDLEEIDLKACLTQW